MPARTIEEAFEQARTLDAPLNERLGDFANSIRSLNAPFAAAVDGLIARLRKGSAFAGSPKEGDAMPSFLLPDEAGRLVRLDDLLAKGPVAVTFARGHWCPYCRIAVSALADIADDARVAGGQIVAIVPDRQPFAARLKQEAGAPFPILTDLDNGYALSLGLVFWVGDEMRTLMLARGADPSQSQGNDSWFVPVPATFVVGRDGIITARHVDPDYRRRMEIDAVLAALEQAAGA
jgi:peroxiredoxin